MIPGPGRALLLLPLLLGAASGAPALAQGGAPAASTVPREGIAAERLEAHVRFLASDELEGRATGSEGVVAAGEYLAAQLAEAGLVPAGDEGTFQQYVPFGHRKAHDKTESWYSGELQRKKLKFARRLDHAGLAGTWLTCHPHMLNGNTLSSQEFCDNLRLRYNLLPLDMPKTCEDRRTCSSA